MALARLATSVWRARSTKCSIGLNIEHTEIWRSPFNTLLVKCHRSSGQWLPHPCSHSQPPASARILSSSPTPRPCPPGRPHPCSPGLTSWPPRPSPCLPVRTCTLRFVCSLLALKAESLIPDLQASPPSHLEPCLVGLPASTPAPAPSGSSALLALALHTPDATTIQLCLGTLVVGFNLVT